MKKTFSTPQFRHNVRSRIRTRLLIGTAIMLVPQLILATFGYAIFTFTISELDDAITSINKETLSVMDLQKSLLLAPMPANDYLIHGNKEEKENYQEIRASVIKSFASVKENTKDHSEITHKITLLESAWHKADILSLEILNAERNNQPELFRNMEIMDQDFTSIANGLDTITNILTNEIKATQALSKKSRLQIQLLIFSVFVIGFLVAVITAYLLARSIINPLELLRDGTRIFSSGELSHRVFLETDDEIQELAIAFNNMADTIHEAQSVLKYQATRDDLTGLLNRREFHQQLDNEIAEFERQHQPVCLFLLDIDSFKNVNDTYGHPTGDAVLREISYRITQHIRPKDSAMRYGGEEFVIILPHTTPEDAAHVAERIRKAVADSPILVNEHKMNITVSIGVACMNETGHTDEEFIKTADEALYQSKENGRNQTTFMDMRKKTE
ncbi:MAG: diguanylate cyclase [Gammaproteobacteria bacterium]|nr:diguanylate cyclase [Gammaproteobacteria bacterium]